MLRLYLRRPLLAAIKPQPTCIKHYSQKSPFYDLEFDPLPRKNEKTDTKRARLMWQSRKRGILETDLLLSRFAKKYLPSMSREQLDEYDNLLDEQDWDIFYWATKNEDVKPCPEKWKKSEIMTLLQKESENKEREVMRMPDISK